MQWLVAKIVSSVLPVCLGGTVLLTGLAGCNFPRDPQGTLERVRKGTLRVGVSENSPWVVQEGGGEPGGVEPELARSFARSLGARIEWHWGGQDEHLEALERYQLDLVLAGLTESSPWKKRVSLTRPFFDEAHVLAVPPGENGWLVELERFLAGQRVKVREALTREGER